MEHDQLAEVHAEAVPLAQKIRMLELELTAWRTKQTIEAELAEKRDRMKNIIHLIAGIIDVDAATDDATE